MNVVLLTAAGSGTRMQLNIPKQFIHVDDKPVIIYTMEAFQNHPSIDAIIVVTIDSWSDVLWAYARQFGITKLKWVVPGGNSGQESIRKGLDVLHDELSDEDKLVVARARRAQRFLSQPFFVAEQFTGLPGVMVPLSETIRGFKMILSGEMDEYPEQAFLNVGTIDEAIAKGKKLLEEAK